MVSLESVLKKTKGGQPDLIHYVNQLVVSFYVGSSL